MKQVLESHLWTGLVVAWLPNLPLHRTGTLPPLNDSDTEGSIYLQRSTCNPSVKTYPVAFHELMLAKCTFLKHAHDRQQPAGHVRAGAPQKTESLYVHSAVDSGKRSIRRRMHTVAQS